MSVKSIESGTIWVCTCCLLSHANGECCSDDTHGGDDIAPWDGFDFDRYEVSMGLLREQHADGCDGDDDCDCERDPFSTSTCEGCGSSLHGERHAFTLWTWERA